MNIVDVLAILPYFVSAIVLGLRQSADYRIYHFPTRDGTA
jgi:hypothetical protein